MDPGASQVSFSIFFHAFRNLTWGKQPSRSTTCKNSLMTLSTPWRCGAAYDICLTILFSSRCAAWLLRIIVEVGFQKNHKTRQNLCFCRRGVGLTSLRKAFWTVKRWIVDSASDNAWHCSCPGLLAESPSYPCRVWQVWPGILIWQRPFYARLPRKVQGLHGLGYI